MAEDTCLAVAPRVAAHFLVSCSRIIERRVEIIINSDMFELKQVHDTKILKPTTTAIAPKGLWRRRQGK